MIELILMISDFDVEMAYQFALAKQKVVVQQKEVAQQPQVVQQKEVVQQPQVVRQQATCVNGQCTYTYNGRRYRLR